MAGLPPTSIKGAGDSSYSTFFKLDTGDYPVSYNGITAKIGPRIPKNYISAVDGTKIGAWTTYADAAATSPVDGTGGSPTVTFATSTDSSLRGTTNFLFTHAASNQQGQGFSYNFTIDPADTGKVLRIDFDYMVASGTYADDDLQFWIYDVTNSALIQPAPFKLKNTTLKDHFTGEFQTSLSTSYRLIGHVATTTATAYTLRFTNFSIGQGTKAYGSPVTDWVSYPLTILGVTTDPTMGATSIKLAKWRRVGDSMEIQWTYIQTGAGSAGSGTYLFPLPSGYVIDTTKLNTSSDPHSATMVGNGDWNDGASKPWILKVYPYNSTYLYGAFNSTISGITTIGSVNPLSASAWRMSFTARVPILGWSSSVQTSDQADTRVVAARYSINSSQSIPHNTGTDVVWNNKLIDTHGGMNTSTGVYTFQSPGKFRVSAGLLGPATNSGQSVIYLVKNGSTTLSAAGLPNSTIQITVQANDVVDVVAGDTVKVQYLQTSGVSYTLNTASHYNWFTVEKLLGPSQIAASETVAASYWLSANFAASTTTPINFDSKEYDTHGAVTTSATAWKFTAPISGTYSIDIVATSNSGTPAMKVYKNGIIYKLIGLANGAGVSTVLSTRIKLLAGEYVDIRPNAAITFRGGTLDNDNSCNVAIVRVGNY